MQSARLEQWYIRDGRLHGVVWGHPLLEDGDVITTSDIVEINFAAHKVYTQNTCYALGKIHPRYEAYAQAPMELVLMERLLGAAQCSGRH